MLLLMLRNADGSKHAVVLGGCEAVAMVRGAREEGEVY